MNKKRSHTDKASLCVAILSLIVSLLSLVISFIVWRQDRKASISAIASSYAIDGTYETYSKDNGTDTGRFLMRVSASISNNSGQGCILSCKPLEKYYIPSYKETSISFPGPTELIYKDGVDPFEGFTLGPRESKSISFELYIYIDSDSHNMLVEEFGKELPSIKIEDLLRYLYNKGIVPRIDSPQNSMPMHPQDYESVPSASGQLILYFTTNTGASDVAYVDYTYKEFFDYIYKR